mmetsp:Transcript_61626/g.74136  ORF Transcript_61626/g.74136 Transcript_61626/m.74136 type:complete len:306 (+) Transcript_61626:71-988(+)
MDENGAFAANLKNSNKKFYYDCLKIYQNDLALPGAIRKINKLLQPLTTHHAAKSLKEYYQSRPNLKRYTLETELNRLSYAVDTGKENKESHHRIITDRCEIKSYAVSVKNARRDLIWRCANQSILADVISSLTGSTNLIRPQFLTRAIAEKCSFHLSFSEEEESMTCQCILKILLPIDELSQHMIAKVRVWVHFVPARNQFEVKILNIVPLHISKQQFQSSATYLSSETCLGGLGERECNDKLDKVSNIWIRLRESESQFLKNTGSLLKDFFQRTKAEIDAIHKADQYHSECLRKGARMKNNAAA